MVVASALAVWAPSNVAGTSSSLPGATATTRAPASINPFIPNIDIIDHSTPYAWQVEPTMVINHTGSVFVGWKETDSSTASGRRVGFSYSTDQGLTWAPNTLMDHRDSCSNSDPWMALGPDDRVHYAYLQYSCSGVTDGVSEVNTTNGTWGSPHFAQGGGGLSDKDSIWVAPSGRIYAAWDEGNVMLVTWSDDGGANWARFVDPTDSPGGVLGAIIETAANNTVYVCWWNFNTNNIMFDWSVDGLHWHTDKRVNDRDGSASGGFPEYPLPAMNADQKSGNIYVSWADSRNPTGAPDIFVTTSKDGGLTWSANKQINDDSTNTQYMVDLAIDSKGTVHAAWEDKRSDALNIYYSNSTDNGTTWSTNVKVSSADTPGSYTRPGDYFAIEAGPNDYIYVIWTDGRGDDFDIYYARSPGFPVATVTVTTDPAGLPVTVDGVTAASPETFNWTIGSTHSVSVSSPIPIGPGSQYLWLSWSDGGAMTHQITADKDLTVTARFVKQHQVSIGTSPQGRTVLVDNVSIAARTMFWWDDGVPHWLEAPPQPDDTPDARYEWKSWSDGMARAHSVVLTAPLSLTATFVHEGTLRVTTSSEGIHFFVDDVEYSSPQTFWFELGSSHFVFAPPSQSAPGARYTFVNWSDGGSFGHPIQFSGAMSLEANFRTEFYLTVTSPYGAASGGGWYDEGTIAFVSLSRTSDPGATGVRYAFVGWTGDASGAGAVSDGILMDGPKSATAAWRTEYFLQVDSDVGTVEGTGWYLAGETVQLRAPLEVTESGSTYRFAGWTGSVTSAEASIAIDMVGPMTVRATWEPAGGLGTLSSPTAVIGLAVLVVVLAAVVGGFVWRRRRRRD